MITFCTLSDKNYLHKGLALYLSIKNTLLEDFTLHWLCMDFETYDALATMNKPGIVLHYLPDMETSWKYQDELKKMKNNPAGKYGTQYSNYCWSLTPWFIYKVLTEMTGKYLIYADSDIMFLHSPRLIADTVKHHQAGIHTHRFTGKFHETESGWYNVGVLYFKNSDIAKEMVAVWKTLVSNTANPHYLTHGTCGDQKYLEILVKNYTGDIKIFDQETNITHLAPWCTDIEPGKQCCFFHFSHFRHNLETNEWFDSLHGEWKPALQPGMQQYYQQYFQLILQADKYIVPKLSIVGNIRLPENDPQRLKYLLSSLKSLEFYKRHCEIILNIDSCPANTKKLIRNYLTEAGFSFRLYFINHGNYGNMYTHLLALCTYKYVMNFIEDHFCLVDYPDTITDLLYAMQYYKADVLKATFFEVEVNSIKNINDGIQDIKRGAFIFENHQNNFDNYCKHYGQRYYLGVNFITSVDFAKKFWNRDFKSERPHEWEIVNYDPAFKHTVIVPLFPVLASIDDDHGEPGTALINKKAGNNKFQNIYTAISN